MKDDKKQTNRQEKTSKWRRFAKKRWIYPAVYISFAALIIAGVLWMQRDTGDLSMDQPKGNNAEDNSIAYDENESVPVNKSSEKFAFPVNHKEAVHVQTPFYDDDASAKEQEAALVLHHQTYRPNTGVDYANEEGNSFTVTASMSGDVVRAEKDPSLGYVVKIDHGDDITTLYQSLKDAAVEKGDTVKQGQKIAKAGTSAYNKEAGPHLHFEIRKDGKPVNPTTYLKQAKSDLPDWDQGKQDEDDMDKDNKMDDMKKDNDKEDQKDQKGQKDQKDSSKKKDDSTTSDNNNKQDQGESKQ